MSSKAAVLGAVALVAATPFRIARLGGGLDALRDDDVLTAALRGPIGVSTTVTALAVARRRRAHDRGLPPWVPTAFTIVALGGFAIEGHTRTPVRRWWLVGSDVVHLVAAAVWLGGLVALVLAFRAMSDARVLAGMVRRFSDVALIAVGIVAVTGVTMAWIILPSAGELTSTGYGLRAAPQGGARRRRDHPRRLQPLPPRSGCGGSPSWSRRRTAAGCPGPCPPLARRHRPGRARPVACGRRRHRRDGDAISVELDVRRGADGAGAGRSPRDGDGDGDAVRRRWHRRRERHAGRVGSNAIDIELHDVEGASINPYEAPVVELSLPASGIGPLRPEVLPLGIGRYQANADLGFAGSWELSIRVRTGEFESVVGTTTVAIE